MRCSCIYDICSHSTCLAYFSAKRRSNRNNIYIFVISFSCSIKPYINKRKKKFTEVLHFPDLTWTWLLCCSNTNQTEKKNCIHYFIFLLMKCRNSEDCEKRHLYICMLRLKAIINSFVHCPCKKEKKSILSSYR